MKFMEHVNFDDVKKTIKSAVDADTLVSLGLIEEAHIGYVCPNPSCRDGSGDDGTGTTYYDDTKIFYCGKCGRIYDVFDVVAFNFNLDVKADFREVLKKAAELFGYSHLLGDEKTFEPARQSRQPMKKKILAPSPEKTSGEALKSSTPKKDREGLTATDRQIIQRKTYADTQADIWPLEDLLKREKLGGFWRGLPLDILLRFNCRFIKDWLHPKTRYKYPNLPKTPRIIIPADVTREKANYLARLILPPDTDEAEYIRRSSRRSKKGKWYEVKPKENAGTKTLFNPDALNSADPVFVVEGQVDAMSIEYAGFHAVATQGAKIFESTLLPALEEKQIKPHLIILLDCDETGRNTAPLVKEKLSALGVPAVIRFLSDEETKLDCNDILVNEGVDALKEKLAAIVEGTADEFKAAEKIADETAAQVATQNKKKKSKAQKEQEACDAINAKRQDAFARLEELRAAPDTPENRDEIKKLLWQVCEWNRDNRRQPTTIKASVRNLDLIFEYDKQLKDLVGYEEFAGEKVALKELPWHSSTGDEWTDDDESQLAIYLRRNYADLHCKETVCDYLIDLAHRNAFHVVKNFFKTLPKWDGKERAETLFIKFLHADDTPYVREVTMNWLTAAVARIFYPGCDYQLAPILFGNQGIGKSYLLGKLGGSWYGALLDDVGDPHAIDAIQKLWLVEVKEMASMKKDVDANKRFIDNAVDIRRFAYERHPRSAKRHCVFMITTNNETPLTDVTGNRRYPVIKCNSERGEYVDGLTPEFISQVWSEVYQKFNEKFSNVKDVSEVGRLLELSREVKRQILENADTYTRDDGLTNEIKGFLDMKIPPQIIWQLMTREQRRQFIAQGEFKIEVDKLNRLFKLSKCRSDGEYDDFKAACEPCTAVKFSNDGFNNWLVFYGSELRQHICASEIFNEMSGIDKRKTMIRINEILSQLDGWQLGDRLRNVDTAYRDMKRVYYRN